MLSACIALHNRVTNSSASSRQQQLQQLSHERLAAEHQPAVTAACNTLLQHALHDTTPIQTAGSSSRNKSHERLAAEHQPAAVCDCCRDPGVEARPAAQQRRGNALPQYTLSENEPVPASEHATM
jgi:hypothetical protein